MTHRRTPFGTRCCLKLLLFLLCPCILPLIFTIIISRRKGCASINGVPSPQFFHQLQVSWRTPLQFLEVWFLLQDRTLKSIRNKLRYDRTIHKYVGNIVPLCVFSKSQTPHQPSHLDFFPTLCALASTARKNGCF